MKVCSVLLIIVFNLTTNIFSQVLFDPHTITANADNAYSVPIFVMSPCVKGAEQICLPTRERRIMLVCLSEKGQHLGRAVEVLEPGIFLEGSVQVAVLRLIWRVEV